MPQVYFFTPSEVANASVDIGTTKAKLPFKKMLFLAVMMAIAAKEVAGKIMAMFFPIMTFVTIGFEHSVANMYFIPAGIFAKGKVAWGPAAGEALSGLSWGTMWSHNLIAVTLGNIVGGVIFVGLVYFYGHVRDNGQAAEEEVKPCCEDPS